MTYVQTINTNKMTNANNNAEKQWLKKLISGKKTEMAEKNPETNEIEKTETTDTKDKRGFNDVVGMDELKQLVTEGFINVLKYKECATAYGITPPSILLYGPTGCGKTFFAEKMAEEVDICFIKVVPDDLASTLVHGTQEKIGKVFKDAEKKAPAILFFDEFETMVPQRSNDDKNYQNGETNEFLCMLNNAAKRGVYVVAATNHPERIDKAALRTGRIDEIIYVGMPDEKAREELFQLELAKLPSDKDIDCRRLADLSKGFNCSDISYVVKNASRRMFNESIKEKGKPPYKNITQKLLEEIIALKKPSVSSRDLRDFERMRMEFSHGNKGSNQKTIGFHL